MEKKDSIKTLLLTLWKSEDDKVTKTESGELGSAVSAYIERIQSDRSIVPSFNTFYEYMRDDYRKELAQRDIKVEKSDFNIDNMLTTMRQYYRGGRYDFLLNSTENIDLLGKRFIVFEIDSIKENRELFPVVTIIIMEAFINKMRRLKGVRKQLIVEEAWKALSSANMAEYLRYMYKTVRKYYGEAIVVTQEVDDIITSPVVKESIINNSDCKILLDQSKYMNKFDQIQALLGLTEKEKSQILSINMANNPSRLYKEVWIGLGGTQSAVYATEVSAEEYLAYTTEETEKVEVYRLAEKLGDDIEAAIRQLAEKRRTKTKKQNHHQKTKTRMNLPKVKMLQVSKCLIGLAVMMLQSCDVADNRRDMLCGNWESVEGKPDVLIYKEGEAYKVTVFRRSGLRRKLKPETYLLQEENGNLFMNTGFRIDVSYNEATDVLTFSPNGDYVRVKPQPGHPTEE
ncbi:conjugation system ATPase, TraG family protein [Bacteroides ovatus str. 3725 D9 iii]|nr:conjugation system ATPase, TraG family protein [Bacteroides ovatus str. 3725 D9 iii]